MIDTEQIEQAIISACVADPIRQAEAAEYGISPAHFQYAKYRVLWLVLPAIIDQHGHVDEVILLDYLRSTTYRDSPAANDPGVHGTDATILSGIGVETVMEIGRVESHAGFSHWMELLHQAHEAREYSRHLQSQLEALKESPRTVRDRIEETANWIISMNQAESRTLLPVSELAHPAYHDLEMKRTGQQERGLSFGLVDVDQTLTLQPGHMVVLAARPSMGKSALAIKAAYAAANRQEPVNTLIFSLEMGSVELTQRLISMHGRIDLRRYIDGVGASPEHVQRIAGEVENMPVWIEEAAPINSARIRSTARRMKMRNNIGLIVIDYLQLADSADPKLSREQSISEISRSCKLMAKELSVPVLALAQLNRQVEHRDPPIPKLSDIRDCMPLDQWVHTPSGPVKIGDKPTSICSNSEKTSLIKPCFYVQKKYNKLYRLTTGFGEIRATPKHLVLTGLGWKQMAKIDPMRDVIAVPKKITVNNGNPQPNGRLLGWLLGNGHMKGTPTLCMRPNFRDSIEEEASCFGVKPYVMKSSTSKCLTISLSAPGRSENPITRWLKEMDLWGKLASEKSVPPSYLNSDTRTRISLLKGLFEAGGCVSAGNARYDTISELLANQVKWLLLAVGVRSRIMLEGNLYRVHINPSDNNTLIDSGICSDSQRFPPLKRHYDKYADPAPAVIAEYCYEQYKLGNCDRVQLTKEGRAKRMSKSRAMELLGPKNPFQDTPYFRWKNVGWASVVSLEKLDGEHRICDLQVPQTNCFVADGIIAHNSGSLEQDADAVLFVSPTQKDPEGRYHAGGRMLISVAKNRHGPTTTIPVTFESHFTNFTNYVPEPEL